MSALRVQLRTLQQEQEAVLGELISTSALAAARASLDSEFETGLRLRTGYSTDRLPRGLSQNRKAWSMERERELGEATRAALGVLLGAAEVQYERVLLPAIQKDIEGQAWRTARAKLATSPIELVVAAGGSTEGIATSQLDEAFASLRSRLRVREDLLIDEWTRVEAGLHRWIERRATELENSLRARRLRSGVATRNHLMALAFGHPKGRNEEAWWYGPRVKRLLLLSATPFEADLSALYRQLDLSR